MDEVTRVYKRFSGMHIPGYTPLATGSFGATQMPPTGPRNIMNNREREIANLGKNIAPFATRLNIREGVFV